MDWKQDRKYVLEALDRQEETQNKIQDSLLELKDCVITKVHSLDKRTVTIESRMKILIGGVMGAGAFALNWLWKNLTGE